MSSTLGTVGLPFTPTSASSSVISSCTAAPPSPSLFFRAARVNSQSPRETNRFRVTNWCSRPGLLERSLGGVVLLRTLELHTTRVASACAFGVLVCGPYHFRSYGLPRCLYALALIPNVHLSARFVRCFDDHHRCHSALPAVRESIQWSGGRKPNVSLANLATTFTISCFSRLR